MRSRYTIPFTQYMGNEIVTFITSITSKLSLTNLEHLILMAELEIQHRKERYGDEEDD